MRTERKTKAQIKKLESDNRYKAPNALMQINASLALIQVGIQAKIDALKWVLSK